MLRRNFLRNSAAAGLTILPSGIIRGGESPNNKLNIALIGAWGRGLQHHDSLSSENIVALCDVDENHLELASKKFPAAQKHIDWRKCLDQKGIDAVVICTPDHHHAFISNWAINRGLHVYCEKPLGITVNEVRTVRANYLKNKDKIATQVGTQRHQIENFARTRELIRDGAIGELESVFAWGNRQIPRPGYFPAAGDPPANLHYDLWLGPSPFHPYNPGYFGAKPGANCLNWNMFWDFGAGQIGDMGAHTMDLAWNPLDADLPTSAAAVMADCEPFNKDVTPVKAHTAFEIPANDWRKAIQVHWFQGGAMPKSPKPFIDLDKIGHGAMWKGSKGFLLADFDTRMLMPYGKDANMTYYKPRPVDKLEPPINHFQKEWIEACKGSLKTSCNMDYNGKMTEMLLLGLVAYRVGKKLEYDGATGKVTNVPEANDLLSKPYREGWTLNG